MQQVLAKPVVLFGENLTEKWGYHERNAMLHNEREMLLPFELITRIIHTFSAAAGTWKHRLFSGLGTVTCIVQ